MNCAARFPPHVRERAERLALWSRRSGRVDFAGMGRLAAAAQGAADAEALRPGDAALVLAAPGPPMFAAVLGLLGRGVTVVFLEPWLPIPDIEHVVRLVQPRVFIGSRLAQLWGLQVRAVREIPRWLSLGSVTRGRRGADTAYGIEDVDPSTPAIITFTSGTTGRPKGIVRTHGYMWSLHEIVTDHGRRDAYEAPDLCVFPNLALLHLGTGRGAVLAPRDWSERGLRAVDRLPAGDRPASLSCGPTFVDRMNALAERSPLLESLRSINVGGAQTDCATFERGFGHWPDATWRHVYGGTEAEPVALTDAVHAVGRSRARGLFQALHLGRPIPELETRNSAEGMWVSGPNVVSGHIGDVGTGRDANRIDEDGRVWHCMGDRIVVDDEGWWYAGRASQPAEDFDLEQRIYARIGSSACFVARDADGRLHLYGESVRARAGRQGIELLRVFPELYDVHDVTIVRDRRHRARIDRKRTLERA
ncbi:MAG TPA: class I adenylate-forming enzyme family protein [Longimicrobiales bacterium]|nr:class I adenylate-forming enzyme family protein [Longimicrobiales bacterium]